MPVDMERLLTFECYQTNIWNDEEEAMKGG